MNNYAVYILKGANGAYYVGVTNDLERRFLEHQNGENPKPYTYSRRPLKLVFQEYFHDINRLLPLKNK